MKKRAFSAMNIFETDYPIMANNAAKDAAFALYRDRLASEQAVTRVNRKEMGRAFRLSSAQMRDFRLLYDGWKNYGSSGVRLAWSCYLDRNSGVERPYAEYPDRARQQAVKDTPPVTDVKSVPGDFVRNPALYSVHETVTDNPVGLSRNSQADISALLDAAQAIEQPFEIPPLAQPSGSETYFPDRRSESVTSARRFIDPAAAAYDDALKNLYVNQIGRGPAGPIKMVPVTPPQSPPPNATSPGV